MPAPEQILNGLREIANNWRAIAIFWHVYFAAVALGLIFGVRLSKRATGILLALPLFSVSGLAWSSANPFNGIVFALLGILMVVISVTLPWGNAQIAPLGIAIPGVLMFIFGWAYPHFLETPSFVPYLYSAPTGLIPCPTLSIVIGLALILDGLGSRPWSFILGAAGLFYGIFGAARLGVIIDVVLLLGALILVLAMFIGKSTRGADGSRS